MTTADEILDRLGVGGTQTEHAGTEPEPRTWRPVDLAPILTGTHKPITPDVGARSDGVGMFYPSRCHTIASEAKPGNHGWLNTSAPTNSAVGTTSSTSTSKTKPTPSSATCSHCK